MSIVTVKARAYGKPGEFESHWGHVCTIGPEGELTAEVHEDLIPSELEAGRIALIEPTKRRKGAE